MFLGCAAAFKVFKLDEHGQSALKLAIQVSFVPGKLLQPMGLQPFANGLVNYGVVMARFFFLLVAQRVQLLCEKAGQTFGIGGVFIFLYVFFPPVS